MIVTVDLDSFWVGFVAGLAALFVIGGFLNAYTLRKAKKQNVSQKKK